MTLRGPNRHTKGMLNFGQARIVSFVIADKTGQYRETRGIRRSPAFRTPHVGREIEHRAGVGLPALRAAVPPRGEQLVQTPAIAIDDEQVTIAARASARYSAFDEA